MKSKKEETTTKRTVRNQYTAQFKGRALERAGRDGIPKVAQDLGLAAATPHSWRAKRRRAGRLKAKSSSKPNCRALSEKMPALGKGRPS
jgi:transposase-like protein